MPRRQAPTHHPRTVTHMTKRTSYPGFKEIVEAARAQDLEARLARLQDGTSESVYVRPTPKPRNPTRKASN
jgi:hypothetical protein